MRASDEAEFEAFVAAVSTRMLRTAYAVCRDRQLAEDAVQSALTSACLSWGRVQAAADPEAYVRRIVLNQVLGWRRRRSWGSEVLRERLPDPGVESHEDDVLGHEVVWDALGQLPPRQRAVLVLRYFEDLSEQDIAAVLGVRPGTVKSQASAGMAHLRATLGAVVPERR